MSKEALKLMQDLRTLADRFSEGWHDGIKIDASDIMLLSAAAEALAEQPAQQEPHRESFWCMDLTCKKCYSADFRFKHTNPKPAQQEPVAWGIVAINTGRICQVELDADEVEGHNPKHIVPLYTSPQPSKPLTDEQWKVIANTLGYLFITRHQKEIIEAALSIKEKNNG